MDYDNKRTKEDSGGRNDRIKKKIRNWMTNKCVWVR
jgi:hypothetical protein